MKYTAEGLFFTEEEAKTDLDTCGYAGKWNKAKTAIACRPGEKLAPPCYWDAVRLYFLELGGCWLAERCLSALAAEPATLPNGRPAGMSYTEWMLGGMPHPPVGGPLKVREG